MFPSIRIGFHHPHQFPSIRTSFHQSAPVSIGPHRFPTVRISFHQSAPVSISPHQFPSIRTNFHQSRISFHRSRTSFHQSRTSFQKYEPVFNSAHQYAPARFHWFALVSISPGDRTNQPIGPCKFWSDHGRVGVRANTGIMMQLLLIIRSRTSDLVFIVEEL